MSNQKDLELNEYFLKISEEIIDSAIQKKDMELAAVTIIRTSKTFIQKIKESEDLSDLDKKTANILLSYYNKIL